MANDSTENDIFAEALALVHDFHVANKLPVGEYPQMPESRPERERITQGIEQEAVEVAEAIRRGDLEWSAKEICDLLYVTLGAAISLGLPLAPAFRRVHESNMTKESVTSVDGTPQKPHKGRDFRDAKLTDLIATVERP